MSPGTFENLLVLLCAFTMLAALLLYWILSGHRRKQEEAARKILVQFADYMLANLMSPKEITLIDNREDFADDESFNAYRNIYVEASRLSARQNLTGEDLSALVERAKVSAEEFRRSTLKVST